MPLEDQAEIKRLKAVAAKEIRNREKTRIAQLPTPDRNREKEEKRMSDAARKRKSRAGKVELVE